MPCIGQSAIMLTGGFLSMIKEYSISGMSCAACSASVERAVRRISGVDAASVNLSTEKLFVRSTNDLSDEIFAAVQKVGFGIAPVVSAKKQSAIDAERRRLDIKKRRSNLILAAVFAIPLFYISMGHMVGLPVPAFITEPRAFAVTQMILLLPVPAEHSMCAESRRYSDCTRIWIRLLPSAQLHQLPIPFTQPY